MDLYFCPCSVYTENCPCGGTCRSNYYTTGKPYLLHFHCLYLGTGTVWNIISPSGVCFSFKGNELLYRTAEGDVVQLNIDTLEQRVVVPNQLFVSTFSPRTVTLLSAAAAVLSVFLMWVCLYFCLYPIQDRSRAAKYQVSPDMQHVLFAFEVKPVRNLAEIFCFLRLCPFLTATLFSSTEIPTLLWGEVHHLQSRDTVSTNFLSSSSTSLYSDHM